MCKILVTGGTVFVSRFTAAYFVNRGYEVWVLNRNTRPQVPGVHLIEGDRHALGEKLKGHHFDAVLDICAYTRRDVEDLVRALGTFGDYIFISSSAVYPETLPRPFREDQNCGPNCVWGAYGTNKLEAEDWLRAQLPDAYILRPPYIYGPMQNVYREGFVFDCARENRVFCLPGEGELELQFFHVEDLCRFMEILLQKRPGQKVFNVGNPDTVTVRHWAALCYAAAGAEFRSCGVTGHPQRSFFPFYDYAYCLDVSAQRALMPEVKSLEEGLRESWRWYRENEAAVVKKPLLDYICREIYPEGQVKESC